MASVSGSSSEARRAGTRREVVLGRATRVAEAVLGLGERLRGTGAVPLLIFVALTGFVVLRGIDEALGAMHVPGGTAGTASGIAALASLTNPEAVTAVVGSWREWAASAGTEFRPPATLLLLYFVIDTLAVALPLLLLLAVLLAAARASVDRLSRVPMGEDRPDLGTLHAVVAGGAVLALAYAAADAVENGLLLIVHGSGGDRVAVRLLTYATLAKVVAFCLAALPWLLVARVRALYRLRAWRQSGGAGQDARKARQLTVAPLTVLRAQVATVLAAAALMFAIPGEAGRQVADVVIGLAGSDGSHILYAGAAALVLALLLLVTARLCITWYHAPTGPEPGPLTTGLLLGLLAGGLLAAVLGAIVAGVQSAGWVLTVLGGGVALFALLSWPVRATAERPDDLDADGVKAASALASLLAYVPPAVLGVLALRGALSLWVARQPPGGTLALAVAMGLACLAPFAWSRLVTAGPTEPGAGAEPGAAAVAPAVPLPRIAAVAAVATVATAVSAGGWPLVAGPAVGSLTIAFAFFGVFLVVATALVGAGDHVRARGAFVLLGFRRMPFLLLVAALFVTVSTLNVAGGYHDMRPHGDGLPVVADVEDPAGVSIDEAFVRWLRNHAGPEEQRVGQDPKRHVPMLFVASAGGGIRAAYWTGLALDCLFVEGTDGCDALPPGASTSIFAASGISGGSAGLAGFRASGDGHSSTSQIFVADFLAPSVAAMAFRDAPNALLHVERAWDDRAAVLERAWEAAATAAGMDLEAGFLRTSYTDTGDLRFPLLMLNGAAVEDGCRVTASVLRTRPARPSTDGGGGSGDAGGDGDAGSDDAGGSGDGDAGGSGDGDADATGQAQHCLTVDVDASAVAAGMPPTVLARTRDAFDFTCFTDGDGERGRRDLRLSTAALLSARFPLVSPSGGLPSCTDPERRTFVVDGGMIDTSGAGPLVELWSVLSPLVRDLNADPGSGVCVEPRLVLLDNDYADLSVRPVPRRPQELTAPARAFLSAAGGASAAARQAATNAFQATMIAETGCRQPDGVEGDGATEEPAAEPGGVGVETTPTHAVAHLYPQMHPGPRAPLGWTLSSWAQEDLSRELSSTHNTCQLARIRGWFDPPGGGTVPCRQP